MLENLPPTKIRVVLPSYNEAKRIRHSVDLISDWEKSLPPNLEFEWLWVNDGSSDNTLSELMQHSKRLKCSRVLSYTQNRGKGFACKTGVLDLGSDPELIFFMDVDFSIPLKHLMEFVEAFSAPGVAAVIGNRNPNTRAIHEHRHRNFMSTLFRSWVSFRLGLPVSDTQCGFKGFRAPVARLLFEGLRINKFTFDVEILIRAHLKKLSIVELAVECVNDGPSSVRVFRDSLRMCVDIEKLRRQKRQLGPDKF